MPSSSKKAYYLDTFSKGRLAQPCCSPNLLSDPHALHLNSNSATLEYCGRPCADLVGGRICNVQGRQERHTPSSLAGPVPIPQPSCCSPRHVAPEESSPNETYFSNNRQTYSPVESFSRFSTTLQQKLVGAVFLVLWRSLQEGTFFSSGNWTWDINLHFYVNSAKTSSV